MLGNDQRKLLR